MRYGNHSSLEQLPEPRHDKALRRRTIRSGGGTHGVYTGKRIGVTSGDDDVELERRVRVGGGRHLMEVAGRAHVNGTHGYIKARSVY